MFASGSGNFHYQKDNNIEQSDFDLVSVLDKLRDVTPDVGGVIGASGNLLPSVDATDAAAALATRVMLDQLKTSVDLLAACSAPTDGWISVSVRVSHLLLPDKSGFASYGFSPGDSPGYEFMKAIGRVLTDTDMANWGVLFAMVTVLAKYSAVVGSDTTPMLLMQISK
jgi:hypothetical protein